MTSDVPERPPERHDKRNRDQVAVDLAVRLAALGIFAYFALILVRPFIPVLLWSVVLAVAFHPAFEWLKARFGGRAWLASGCLTVLGLVVVLGPATILIASLIHSLEHLAHQLGAGRLDLQAPPKALEDLPVVGDNLRDAWSLASSNLREFVARYGKALLGVGEWALHAVEGLAGSVLAILPAVVIAGFLHVPGPRLVQGARAFAHRVAGGRGSGFVDLAGATIRNVGRGVIGVGIIQSLLIGLGLIVAEVPAAGLLTLAVLVLTILQIGSLPVLVPLLIWAWFGLGPWPTLLLGAYLIPVGLFEHVLKALLMGKGLRTPMLVIFAGVFGGTVSYGLIGLFVGPIVLAVFYDLVLYWVAAEPAGREGGIE